MIRVIAQLLMRLFGEPVNREPVAPVRPPPPFAGPMPDLNGQPDADDLPPEAKFALWQQPPIALLRKQQLTGVQADGSIPQKVEFMRLTAAGPVEACVEFVLHDDFGGSGLASDLKRCHLCGRFGFTAVQACPACGQHACPTCSAGFEQQDGVVLRVCAPCKQALELSRDNWSPKPGLL